MLAGAEGRNRVLFGAVIAALPNADSLELCLRLVEALAVLGHDLAELAGQAIPIFELDPRCLSLRCTDGCSQREGCNAETTSCHGRIPICRELLPGVMLH